MERFWGGGYGRETPNPEVALNPRILVSGESTEVGTVDLSCVPLITVECAKIV